MGREREGGERRRKKERERERAEERETHTHTHTHADGHVDRWTDRTQRVRRGFDRAALEDCENRSCGDGDRSIVITCHHYNNVYCVTLLVLLRGQTARGYAAVTGSSGEVAHTL